MRYSNEFKKETSMKWYFVVLLVGVLFVITTPCWASWEQDVKAANAAKEAGKYDEAIQLYTKALDTGQIPIPPFVLDGFATKENKITEMTVRAELAACLYKTGDIEGAIAQYTELISVYTPLVKSTKKIAKASDMLDIVIRVQVLYAVYGGRSMYYARNAQYDLAIADLEKGLQFDSEADSLYKELGWLLATCPEEQYRDAKRALEYAKKAIAKERKAESLTLLAASYAEDGNFEEAIKTQQQALSRPEYKKYLESYEASNSVRNENIAATPMKSMKEGIDNISSFSGYF